ncbi:MAG: efflux RND transporter periplasmic adaptor subunit [Pseudomonadota bacterium]
MTRTPRWKTMTGRTHPLAGLCLALALTAFPAAAADPVRVVVLDVVAEDRASDLLVNGRTMAARRVDVEAETPGVVISEPLRRGTKVAAGDLLCRLDGGSRQAQLREAEAKFAEAEAEAVAAERLSERGFAAETTRRARQAEREAAQAAVELMELDIKRLEIRAPFDGHLESDTAELGARLDVGESCATVVDLATARAAGYVGEQAVDLLALGTPATVRLVTGSVVEGPVSFIARVADPDTRTYEVEVRLENPDGLIRDGMTAELKLPLPPIRAHRLPQSALTLDDAGRLGVRLAVEEAGVWRTRFSPVTIIEDRRDAVWVRGLPDAVRVIVVGQDFVRDGGAIDPVPVSWDDLG